MRYLFSKAKNQIQEDVHGYMNNDVVPNSIVPCVTCDTACGGSCTGGCTGCGGLCSDYCIFGCKFECGSVMYT